MTNDEWCERGGPDDSGAYGAGESGVVATALPPQSKTMRVVECNCKEEHRRVGRVAAGHRPAVQSRWALFLSLL